MSTQANNIRTLRPRTKSSATTNGYARNVRDLMAEIEEREIAARIHRARELAGLTQRALAERLHVEPRTYQNYESETNPRIPWGKLNAIAKITGQPSEWLVYGDDLNGPAPTGELIENLARIEAKVDRLVSLLETKDGGLVLAPLVEELRRQVEAELQRAPKTRRKRASASSGKKAA